MCGADMATLTDRAARNIEAGATLTEGTIKGLTLIGGSQKGQGKWNLRYQLNGKRRDMGLGSFPDVGVAAARLAGASARALLAQGVDPIDTRAASRKDAEPVPTFREIAADVISDAQSKTTNKKVRYQWGRYLSEAYCGPLMDRPVDQITTTDIVPVLRSVWLDKPAIAAKLYPAIRRVFEAARIRLRDKHGIVIANPAAWPDLKAMGFETPKKLSRGHYPSLPYPKVPQFMAALREREAVTARVLEFAILANVRSGTARAAEWKEFDLDAGLWVIPAAKLKDKKHRKEPLRIPLSPRAIEIAREMEASRASKFVFPTDKGEPFSDMSLLGLLRRMNKDMQWHDPDGRPIVPHGFRASFKTWCEETAHFPHSIVEEAMGHVFGSGVERAYKRTDLLEQRRKLMNAWAAHCEPTSADNVLKFKKSGGKESA